jgi:predicted nuclease of predicted toxin-antitoxin system
MEIRYHLDESVRGAVANGLRQRGIDVTTSADAGLIGASDAEQLASALAEKRVIVTHDDDFLRLHHQGIIHAGIAYCHQRNRTVGQIIHRLVQLWRVRSAEEMHGQVEFL